MAVALSLLSVFYREARMRFKGLLWWPYLLMFVGLVLPWYLWAEHAFPGLFLRLVRHDWMVRFLRTTMMFPIPLPGVALRVVVPVADRDFTRFDLCLAAGHPAAGNRICRRTANHLDADCVSSPPSDRTQTGLLFDEHVERLCIVGGHGVGPDAQVAANCRDFPGGHLRPNYLYRGNCFLPQGGMARTLGRQ